MVRLLLPIISFSLVGLCSCSSTSKAQTAKSFEIYGAGVIQLPVVAELDVRPVKVVASLTESTMIPVQTMKSMVAAEALKSANADVLVEPVYTTETIGSRTTITVHGYPATYKNFRNIAQADLPLLEAGLMQKATTTEPVVVKKKGGGGLAAGIILGSLLITGLIIGAAGPSY